MYVDIRLKATFETPFSVGTGALGDAWTNRPTIKDGRQQPLIPGSALKGRLRHTCEQLARTLLDDDHAACQAPAAASTCPLDPAWLGHYCPVCRLFGAPRRPSTLMFSDLRWQAEGEGAPTLVRTGVSIRRSRQVAEPQRLYDLEAVDGLQTGFTGAIGGRLNEAEAPALAALLLAGVQALTTLGGGRSSGLGRCRIEVVRARVGASRADAAWQRAGLARLREMGVAGWRS